MNSEFKSSSQIKFEHQENIPNNFRMLIIGETNSGKTNLLLRMILKDDFLDLNNLVIFSSTTHQLEYQLVFHGFNNNLSKRIIQEIFYLSGKFEQYSIEEICMSLKQYRRKPSNIKCTLSQDVENVKDIDQGFKTLVVFDDLVCNKNQTIIEGYFFKGRHFNINCIYLSQSWNKIPKTIGESFNFFPHLI